MRLVEFRLEVVAWSIHSIFWIALTFLFIWLIFGQVQSVAGWTESQVVVLTITFGLFESFLWFFVYPSVLNFSKMIRRGDLDTLLVKPVNTRFAVSFSIFEFDNYGRFLVMMALLFLSFSRLEATLTLANMISFVLLFFIGVFIFYCLFFIMATMSFWFTDLWNLEDFLESIVDVGRFPTYIFEQGFRLIFFYVLPVAYVATFPTEALMGRPSDLRIIAGLMLGIILFIISQLFWKFSLKNYTSASS